MRRKKTKYNQIVSQQAAHARTAGKDPKGVQCAAEAGAPPAASLLQKGDTSRGGAAGGTAHAMTAARTLRAPSKEPRLARRPQHRAARPGWQAASSQSALAAAATALTHSIAASAAPNACPPVLKACAG